MSGRGLAKQRQGARRGNQDGRDPTYPIRGLIRLREIEEDDQVPIGPSAELDGAG